jgi:hypothetical protein
MKAKRLIFGSGLSILLFILTNGPARAQVYIEGFGGWLWTASVPGYRQDLKVDDLGNYGARIGFDIHDSRGVEFEWNHTNTTVHYYDWDLGKPDQIDIALNYYMLGFVQLVSGDKAQPYGLFNIGMLNVSTDQSGYSSFNYFTVGLGGGLKYYFSDHVGIRIQARFLMPMQFSGVGFGCGIGTGGANCGAGVYSYSNLFQGDFTGGLIIKFGG